MSVKGYEKIDEKIKPYLSEVTLNINDAIELIETKIRSGLGKETVEMLPIEGLAIKTLLTEYKKLKMEE